MDVSNSWNLVFNNAKELWFCSVVIFMAVFAIVMSWLVLRRFSSPGLRVLLLTLRTMAAALIVLMIFQPHLEFYEFKKIRKSISIIVDNSLSMSIKNSHSGLQRGEEVATFIKKNRNFVDGLEVDFDVEYLLFSDEVKDVLREDIEGALVCEGNYTDIEGLLRSLKDRDDKEETEAYLLFSDGADNVKDRFSGSGRLEMLIELAKGLPAPLYAFSPVNPNALRDIAIAKIEHNKYGFVRNSEKVKVTVRARGYDGKRLAVTLKEGDKLISSRRVKFVEGKSDYVLDFEIAPNKIGSFIYTVSAPVQKDEISQTNNKAEFSVFAARDKTRILHLCGRPSWDARFLRRVLKQARNIDLISFYILKTQNDVTDVPSSEMSLIPFPIEELFTKTLESFDLVIFQNFDYRPFDIPANVFKRYFNNMKKYVRESGGAFLMIGGDLSFSQAGYHKTELKDILPVDLGFSGSGEMDMGVFKPLLTFSGERHPIAGLDHVRDNNLSIWGKLPGLVGFNKIAGNKPGAVSLASHPEFKNGDEMLPVISVANIGNGRSMAVMTDSLWRWDFLSAAAGGTNRHYTKFWNNAIKWLIKDPELETVNAKVDKDGYFLGETAQISIDVKDSAYLPVAGAKVAINIANNSDAGNSFVKNATTDGQGRFSFSFKPEKTGYYKASFTISNDDGFAENDYVIFETKPVSSELEDISPRHDILAGIAGASGGNYFDIRSVSRLGDFFKPERKQIVKPVGAKDYSLWDNWVVFALILALLGGEWWLRVKNGLK